MKDLSVEEIMRKELYELKKENTELIKIIKNEIGEVRSTLKELQQSAVKIVRIVPENEDYKVNTSKHIDLDDPYYDIPDRDLAFDLIPHESKTESVVSYNRENYPKSQMGDNNAKKSK